MLCQDRKKLFEMANTKTPREQFDHRPAFPSGRIAQVLEVIFVELHHTYRRIARQGDKAGQELGVQVTSMLSTGHILQMAA